MDKLKELEGLEQDELARSSDRHWLQIASDIAAGMGDTISLGGTKWIREQWDATYWDDKSSVDYDSSAYTAGKWSGYAWHVIFQVTGYKSGHEFKLGNKGRIAPWANRTGNEYGKFPHYHRRGKIGPDGQPLPGAGMKRHRPLQPPPSGQPWWKRF